MARPWHEERDDCIYQSPRHQETSVPLGRRDEEKASSPLYTAEGLASRIRHAPSLGRMLHHRRLCLAVVIFSLASAAIFFGAAQLGVYDVSLYVHRPAPGQAKGHYAVDSEPGDDTQRQCTTWPVAGDGSYNSSAARGNYQLKLDSYAPAGGWKKPEGVRVVGVIFYGRRRNVDILDCYLQQNLARNGGYLDEVRFLVHTTEQPDLRYLEQLVEQTVSYSIKDPGSCKGNDYSCMWESLVEDDTIYVKIDDDIVGTRLHAPTPYMQTFHAQGTELTGLYPPRCNPAAGSYSRQGTTSSCGISKSRQRPCDRPRALSLWRHPSLHGGAK